MSKALIIIFSLLLLPYLFFTLPKILRKNRQAKMRFYIFMFTVTVAVLVFLRYVL